MNIQSLKDKLKNIARENGRIYQEVLTVYALERVIFRLSISRYNENFTLKGGIFLYALYEKEYPRSTTDIDLRAERLGNETENLKSVFTEILSMPYDDGIEFNLTTLHTKSISRQDEYEGVNVSVTAMLDNIRIPIAIDIGFGDVIVPSKQVMDFPVMLDSESPRIYSYSLESTVAEKFEAMVSLGYANSRYKDFYDVYIILNDKKIDMTVLKEALLRTFNNRKTSFDDIAVFEDDFAKDAERQKRWNAFIKKKKVLIQISFEEVVNFIRSYFEPVISELDQ